MKFKVGRYPQKAGTGPFSEIEHTGFDLVMASCLRTNYTDVVGSKYHGCRLLTPWMMMCPLEKIRSNETHTSQNIHQKNYHNMVAVFSNSLF